MNTIQFFVAIAGVVLAATAPATGAIIFSINRTDEMRKELVGRIDETRNELAGRTDETRKELVGRIDGLTQQVAGIDARLARVEVLVAKRVRGITR